MRLGSFPRRRIVVRKNGNKNLAEDKQVIQQAVGIASEESKPSK
jgi:hypothetical protein